MWEEGIYVGPLTSRSYILCHTSISFYTLLPALISVHSSLIHLSELLNHILFLQLYLSHPITMVEITVFKGSESGNIIKSTTQKDLLPNEVLVKVTHSGICGTDEHFRHKDMVLGHEGAGIIQVRSAVSVHYPPAKLPLINNLPRNLAPTSPASP